MSKAIKILLIVLRLFLGGMMVYGGTQKFQAPKISTLEVMAKAEKFNSADHVDTLQKILYISGAKQTGYFWEVLGFCEVFFGLLLIIQGTTFVGSILLLPITLHIFLFHAFLEADETGELMLTGALLLVNILLVLSHYKQLKKLLWVSPW